MEQEAENVNTSDEWLEGVVGEVADNTEADEGMDAGDVVDMGSDESQDQVPVTDETEQLVKERDTYLETSRRLQAEFENYRKQVAKRESDSKARAAESLVNEILPTLDACDAAINNGAVDVEPIRATLYGALEKLGLEKMGSLGDRFDPELHDAVSQGGESNGEGPQLTEVMRAGYSWKGKTLRPAMVQVSE